MAVTVTEAQRRAYAGLPAVMDAAHDGVVTTLWEAAVEAVEGHAPDAPERIANVAALSMFAYLMTERGGERADGEFVRAGNALRKSGAMGLLRPYTVHRAGAI